jgi:DNA-binding helix-turn-helix protein
MNIGERIKERRLELGMTQEELADKVGFKTRASVSRLEGGDRNIPISKLKKLAEVLDTTIGYLMGMEDNSGTITTNIGNHNTTNANTNSFNGNSGTMREAIEFIDKDSALHTIMDLLLTHKKDFKKSDLEWLKQNIDYFLSEE